MWRKSQVEIAVRIVVVLLIIIGATSLLLMVACSPSFDLSAGVCQASPNLSILIGAIIGSLTTAIFFVFVELGQKKLDERIKTVLERYARAYIVRTCFLNLKDIFTGEKDSKEFKEFNLLPDDKTLRRFVTKLDDEYIKRFEAEPAVKEIYHLASHHPVIAGLHQRPPEAPTDPHCEYCKTNDLVAKLVTYLHESRNPLQ